MFFRERQIDGEGCQSMRAPHHEIAAVCQQVGEVAVVSHHACYGIRVVVYRITVVF